MKTLKGRNISIIGAGLAGCEAALFLANLGASVTLYEQKPHKFSPAHTYAGFAELVCSNSLKSQSLDTGAGLLKAEMDLLGCRLPGAARETAVAAGGALAVDRQKFSDTVTQAVKSSGGITVSLGEVTAVPPQGSADAIIIATGPLTGDSLFEDISNLTGGYLHFYDAAAPIVTGESIDKEHSFEMSRYGKGGNDYINCPLSEEQYQAFWEQLTGAQVATAHEFEKREIFEGCMPIEVMAARGRDTLRFGPMRPVGLTDPKTGRRPYAALQLRRENAPGTMYNLVGFQTNLKFPEQKRVFSMIPALASAEFVRYGVMHRNSYVNAPQALTPFLQLKSRPDVYIAGQLCGVEGYLESALTGHMAARFAAAQLTGAQPQLPPPSTVTGALLAYLSQPQKNFQPMNANFGLLPPLGHEIRNKQQRKLELANRAAEHMREYADGI